MRESNLKVQDFACAITNIKQQAKFCTFILAVFGIRNGAISETCLGIPSIGPVDKSVGPTWREQDLPWALRGYRAV